MSSSSKARQRITALLDENSFVEIGAKVTARATDFNLKPEQTPSDGVITGYGSIDLIMPGVHKANGLRILQQRWGIEDHEVVAFGDSGNDIEMLQHAGFGFAMANAREDVKAVASHHAPHNNEEGVLQIIDKVLNREAPFA